MKKNEQWIECRIYPGMFSDERAVEVRGKSYFVGKDSVRVGRVHDVVRHPPRTGSEPRTSKPGNRVVARHGEDGQVRVTVIEDKGKRWVVLPTDARDAVEAE